MAEAASGPARLVLVVGQRVLALPEANGPVAGNVPAVVSVLVAPVVGPVAGVRVATAGAAAEARHMVVAMATGQPPRRHARQRSR
jgi:hypothetical protein